MVAQSTFPTCLKRLKAFLDLRSNRGVVFPLRRQVRVHRLPDNFGQKTSFLGRQTNGLGKKFLSGHDPR